MKCLLSNLFVIVILVVVGGCTTDVVAPTPNPSDPSIIEDEKLLYNGIRLPGMWPPARSTSEVENGMVPLYLTNKPDTINISVGRQLFVDDFLVDETDLVRQYYSAQYYYANPVLKADKAWENSGTSGAAFAAPYSDGVWYDEIDNKFKMWYMAGGGIYSVSGGGVTCYAESTDGIQWTKPSLNVVPNTNIVDMGTERDASTVWMDKQETNSSKRLKMFISARGSDSKWRYTYKYSSNGISWRKEQSSKPIADRSTVFKNAFRNIWAFSIRHNIRVSTDKLVRARDYSEHSDPSIGTKNAEALLNLFWFGPWPNEIRHPDYPMVAPAVYNHDAIAYESIMLGQFSIWQGPENDICASQGVIKRNQVMLGYSRDGYYWYRNNLSPFMPVTAGDWISGNVQSVAGVPLIVEDKLYFYASGRAFVSGKEVATTGLATLRRDGFVSMSTSTSGFLKTEKFVFNGEYLFVNANVSGNLYAEVLDYQGEPVQGFAKSESIPFSGDKTKVNLKWSNNTTLKSLKGQVISVVFYLENGGELFAFWISPWETGESNGFTGGGGPGLHVSGIDKK